MEGVSEQSRLQDWRYIALRQLGLSVHDASELSMQLDVAHRAEELVAAGCPPERVYEILRDD